MEALEITNQRRFLKHQLADLRREMREQGIRTLSCFNAGLDDWERYYNRRLFEVKSELSLLPPEPKPCQAAPTCPLFSGVN